MARHLIKPLSQSPGVDGLFIVRNNGREEAFRDLKTINAVKKEHGEVKPEWLTDYPDEPVNAAEGSDVPQFKRAFESFRENWKKGETYYIDSSGGKPVLTYLLPAI